MGWRAGTDRANGDELMALGTSAPCAIQRDVTGMLVQGANPDGGLLLPFVVGCGPLLKSINVSQRRRDADLDACLPVNGPFGDGPRAGEEGDYDYRYEREGKYQGYVFHDRIPLGEPSRLRGPRRFRPQAGVNSTGQLAKCWRPLLPLPARPRNQRAAESPPALPVAPRRSRAYWTLP